MPQNQPQDDFILSARWVLPISSPPIPDGAVRVSRGRIRWVGRAADLESTAGGPRPTGAAAPARIDLPDAALLPGLVNAHSHLELTLLRGMCEDVDFFPWIQRLTEVKYGSLSGDDFLLAARWGALAALRSGVTTVADASDSRKVVDALLESGLRGIVYHEVFGPDERTADESLRQLLVSLDELCAKATDRVRIGVSPHAPYTVSGRLFRAVRDVSQHRGLPMALHVAESGAETAFVRRGEGPFASHLAARGISWQPPGVSPVRYLKDLGVLEARPLLVHVIETDGSDLDLIQTSRASVAHCPKSNAKLCHGVAALPEMLARGIHVGLGTDGAVSSNNCDLLEEARFAVLLQRSRPGFSPQWAAMLAPRAMLRLLTLGAAESLGLESEVGSLETGKWADLTAVRLSGAHVLPVPDPESALVFSATGADVVLTMVEGRVLYQCGVVTTLDEPCLREGVERFARSLAGAPRR